MIDIPDEEPMCVDGVVLATPANSAAGILRSTDRELAGELEQIPHAGCAVVSLGYRREDIAHRLDGFGFVVPLIEGRKILSASFSSVKFSGRAPEQSVLLRVFIGGACQPELVELSQSELISLAQRELRDLLGVKREPWAVDVAHWPAAMPQYHVGHVQRVQRVRRLTAEHRGLELAGKSYDGVGIPSCIRSGEQAAEQLLKRAELL
jgi:oxygen-dependent protoporphyrinogen oxidase